MTTHNRNRMNLGQRRKPWHIQALITEIHKKMKDSVGEWLDAYFKIHAPESVFPHLLNRDKVGLEWMCAESYHYDHKKIKHISDTAFAMVFDLYKKDLVVNTFDFIVTHDGTFKEPHALAAMIFVGTEVK